MGALNGKNDNLLDQAIHDIRSGNTETLMLAEFNRQLDSL